MEPLKLYTTSVTSNSAVRHNQQKLKSVLDSKKIDYEEVDVASMDKDQKAAIMQGMSEKTGQEVTTMPLMPQLFRGSKYIGNYDDFSCAVEDENIDGFLMVPDAEISPQQAQS